MPEPNGNTRVTVPSWSLWMFGIAQPLVIAFLIFVSRLLWGMNQQVTILTVQMSQTMETSGKLEALGERITLANERISRLEGKVDREGTKQ